MAVSRRYDAGWMPDVAPAHFTVRMKFLFWFGFHLFDLYDLLTMKAGTWKIGAALWLLILAGAVLLLSFSK